MLICFALRHTASEAVEAGALPRFNLRCLCSVRTFPYQPATCCDLQPLLRSLHAFKRRRLLCYAPPRLLLEPGADLVRRSHTLLLVLLITAKGVIRGAMSCAVPAWLSVQPACLPGVLIIRGGQDLLVYHCLQASCLAAYVADRAAPLKIASTSLSAGLLFSCLVS